MMQAAPERAMQELLAASLAWWKVDGTVTAEPGGALVVMLTATPDLALRIARAPAGLPFRWQVTCAGRTRSVASIAGVLRTVRAVVDPDFTSMRLQLAGSGPG